MQTEQNPLEAWARNAQKKLAAGYSETGDLLTHHTSIGTVREFVAKEILQTILPTSIEIGTGQIIDANRNLSNQIDLVITRNNVPAFRFSGGVKTYFLETVLATIEVKSIINKDGLFEALDNTLSVKKLHYQGNSLRSKGPFIFDEAFNWVESIGGLDRLDKVLIEPSQENSAFCPDDVIKVIRLVFYWLHWEKGTLVTQYARETLATLFPLDADYEFFFSLLFYILKEPDFDKGMKRFSEAPRVKKQFFQLLYRHIAQDELLPYTYIFAYGGYQNAENLAASTLQWFDKNRNETSWEMMPKVIMNQSVHLFRTFNTYHCVDYEYPLLFLMSSLMNTLMEDINFPVSYGLGTGLQQYFNPEWLGERHPKTSSSYRMWEIPIDNSSSGQIKKPPLQVNES